MENPSLCNVLFAPDLCNQLFSIITLINLGHTCIFNKRFFTVTFSDNKQNAVTLPHSTQKKHASLVKTKEKSKFRKSKPLKESFFEMIASEIMKQVQNVHTGYIYCKCLARHWSQGRSWQFLHIMSDIHNKQKAYIKDTSESQ